MYEATPTQIPRSRRQTTESIDTVLYVIYVRVACRVTYYYYYYSSSKRTGEQWERQQPIVVVVVVVVVPVDEVAYVMSCVISHAIAMHMKISVTTCLPWIPLLFMPFTILVPLWDCKMYSSRTRASK